jgi:hypothetical protein
MLAIGPETNWSRTSMNDELAATELLRRTEAAADLISFTDNTWPRYEAARIHRIIAARGLCLARAPGKREYSEKLLHGLPLFPMASTAAAATPCGSPSSFFVRKSAIVEYLLTDRLRKSVQTRKQRGEAKVHAF